MDICRHVRPVKNKSSDITLIDGQNSHHTFEEANSPVKVEGERQREWSGPVTYTLVRKDDSYGFTLRYFVVYPPTPHKHDFEDGALDKGFDRDSYWLANGLNDCEDDEDEAFVPYKPSPLDTFFVKSVTPGGSADSAGLKSGDRIVSINGDLIGGKTYKDVVELVQYCTGDLKLGVVPHKEDILQLVYQEYIYDGLKQQNGNDLKQRHSVSSMHQPSVNKWSAPLSPRKSLTIDNNNGLPSPSAMSHGAGGGSGSSDSSSKKYDPCVGFFAGTPIIKIDNKQSRSNSITSSGGSNTPNRAGKMSGRTSPKRSSAVVNDPCVSWVAGKPIVNVQEDEGKENNENYGIPPYKLQNALRKEQGKKPYSVGTRLAPKQIAGVSKPGAVSNIAGLFASGNWDELSSTNRKKSATSVLRDDFQMMKSVHKKSRDDAIENAPMKFNLNINVDSKRRTSEPSENEPTRSQFDRTNLNYSSGRHQRMLSSNTSQATLVESRNLKPKEGITALVSNTIVINGGNDKRLSPVPYRKRNLLRGGRKISVSSVENSEDEDSHGESADEGELNNWKGRRVSYLAATSKQNEKAVAKKDDKIPDDADDEDSDATASPTTNRLKFSGQKPEEGETKPVIKEGPLNRKLEKYLDSRKKPSGRTWKPMYAVLKGHRLFCYKKNTSDGDDDIIQPIPIRGSVIEIASGYGKRRHVFRLVTSHGNEYLFQAEDTASMMSWVQTLWEANPDREALMKTPHQVKQEEQDQKLVKDHNKKGLSIRRTPFLRSSKKGRSSNAPPKPSHKPETPLSPPGKTFGIPLHKCPPALHHEKIPLIVEHCCTVIEDKADVIGIYRIPGNAATISALRIELDTKNPDEIQWDEEKWHEVHNISSLLKNFIRQLEDPLVPSNMYTRFITVNRSTDQRDRLKSIKHLTRSLPEYHFETLQFLMRHLKIIVEHSEQNKMDLKNLVMFFGPNIVKSDEVTSLVKDMPDQCKIVETLIKQYDWIFLEDSEGGEPIDFENDGDIISADVSRALTECLNYNNNTQKNVTEQEINENVSKKSNKFSTLRNNISMKLKSTKVTSPKPEKKKGGNISQDEEMETDDDTSGCYSQSPPLSGKVEKRENKFKTKETRTVGKLTVTLNNQRDPEMMSGRITTKLGTVAMNSDVQMNFSSHPRSPELSPTIPRKDMKLTEKTLNRINQLGLAQHTQDFEYKMNTKDDGNDSGVTSPQRFDSDDSDSCAHSSRKESLESLSGPSPRIQRRFPNSTLQRQISNSGSSNEERSPTLHKASIKINAPDDEKEYNDRSRTVIDRSKRRANKSKALNEQKNEKENEIADKNKTKTKATKVVKRSDSAIRRRMHPNSPRLGKRDIKSIIPGDADELEEQLRNLLDGEGVIETNITETKTNALSQRPNTLEIPNESKPVPLSGFDTPDSCHNAEWWLSGTQNSYRRFLTTPKDKASAVNILTSVIDCSRKRNSKERDEIDDMTGYQRGSDYTALVANHKQRNDEFERKVTDILSTSPVSSFTDMKNIMKRDPACSKHTRLDPMPLPTLTSNSASSLSVESRSEKIDKYLHQVALLLGESDDIQETTQEREKIASILKQFQATASVTPSKEKQRIKSDSGGPVNQHKPIIRSHSATVKVDRTSPLLDDTYSNLNYNKLYPR